MTTPYDEYRAHEGQVVSIYPFTSGDSDSPVRAIINKGIVYEISTGSESVVLKALNILPRQVERQTPNPLESKLQEALESGRKEITLTLGILKR